MRLQINYLRPASNNLESVILHVVVEIMLSKTKFLFKRKLIQQDLWKCCKFWKFIWMGPT